MSPPNTTTEDRDLVEGARRAVEQRRAVLGPYLAAMGFTEHGGPPPDLAQEIPFNGRTVVLEPWERNVLLGEATGETEILLAHLAEGIAFRASVAGWLQRLDFEPPPPHELNAMLSQLVEETAVGLALQQEVQRDIDRLVQKGEMGDAKKLTGFRRKIDQALSGLKERISEQSQEQARLRATELITPRAMPAPPRRRVADPIDLDAMGDLPAPIEMPEPAIVEDDPSAEALIAETMREHDLEQPLETVPEFEAEPAPTGQRRRVLLAILAFSVLAYAIFVAVRPRYEVPPALGLEHFEQLGIVVAVKARPPSLYVDLDAASWGKLSGDERLGLLRELGRIAGGIGYRGVQVRTADGRTVGQWLKQGGAKLVRTAIST